MACKNTDCKRKNKDGVINSLKDLFGNVLHIDIIRSVATECNFDVQKSSNVLLEMTNNINDQPYKKKEKSKKKSPQYTPPPKKPEQIQVQPNVVKSRKTLELERVINSIRQGYKVLVILRGLPGSGKSHLATVITDITLGPGSNSQHILSTDDFFWQGQRGYCFDPNRLQEAHEWNHRRAFHAMSRGLSPVIIDNTNTQMWEMKPYAMMATDYGYIIEILEPDTWWAFNEKELARRNTHNVPRTKIKDMLDRYEKNVTTQKLLSAYNLVYKFQKPPQFRLIPPLLHNGFANFRLQNGLDGVVRSKSTPLFERSTDVVPDNVNLMDFSEVSNEESKPIDENPWEVKNPVDEILMCDEEDPVDVLQPISTEPKPFPDFENAWGIDEKALQSWDIVTPVLSDSNIKFPTISSNENESKIETKDESTSTDELTNDCKVITTQSRDINIGSPIKLFHPPRKTMIDQSCITEDIIEDTGDEESRIRDLMDLFPKVSRSSLQELYYRCNKNFHWTVDLLLEDDNLEMAEEALNEETPKEEPQPEVLPHEEDEEKIEQPKEPKVFKRKTVTEDCVELKKCLESKFDINKEHYSDHVYRVKQTKFGGLPDSEEPQPSTSSNMLNSDTESEDDSSNDDNPKNLIELNLGETFVNQLETMFGGNDDAFPKGFQPVVQMPIPLARQIYCFYIESICQQMEAQNHILDRLVREDEDFARKLQSQEDTLQNLERPLSLPEIMDEQKALNLHKKDIDEWKNMTADHLAAKLTKQKLFNAFPNVDKETLLEIWHAYGYDYNKTVEVLIASVGSEGINDAVKEPPLTSTTLQEMKEAEENCGDFEDSLEQQPAIYYREEANKHLKKRAELYEKARLYSQRGMTEVARFYSELAQKETQLYDKANHFAAVAFIEEHAKRLQKFDTLDLHYFYVKEAIPNLDIFIDRNINLLKGSSKRGQDLFVITGRGKNSEGGKCKIKPAVISRLKKRKIGFVQLNPGLLKIRVQRDTLVTSDIA